MQTLHTQRPFSMSVKASSNDDRTQLIVPGIGNVLKCAFDITFVRGPHKWDLPGTPDDALGFLAYNEAESNYEFWDSDAFIHGGLCLPETVFDDVWHRIKVGEKFESMISIQVAPISYDGPGIDELLWDRAKDKFLNIKDATLNFFRDELRRPV